MLPLAASWTANFHTWNAFANWLSNSNWPTYILAAVLPGIFIVFWTHAKVKRHMEAQHVEHMAEIAKIHLHNEWEAAHLRKIAAANGVEVDPHPYLEEAA
jgi:uncharacterized membrane protein